MGLNREAVSLIAVLAVFLGSAGIVTRAPNYVNSQTLLWRGVEVEFSVKPPFVGSITGNIQFRNEGFRGIKRAT